MNAQSSGARHIAVVDVETTGLSPWRHDRIVEIAVVLLSPDGEIEDEYESLVNPGRDVGPTSIHGISASDLIDAPPLRRLPATWSETAEQEQPLEHRGGKW